ncbi:hypothetical protein ABBQ32_010451 [Trebouxia sp. C0010 RCD-2024]
MQNAVLRNTELSICYCSRCRASLAVVAFQELRDSDVPVQPEELFCSQCCNDSMTMVRLATTEQLQDWLTVLHSKPSCKQPRVMQVCCSCPSFYTTFVPPLVLFGVVCLSKGLA